jgi:hypothetical protein
MLNRLHNNRPNRPGTDRLRPIMSSTRRYSPTLRGRSRIIHALWSGTLAVCISAGCSQQEPVVTGDDWSLDSGDTLRAETKAGGVETSYSAHFDGTRIKRISEIRGGKKRGDYEFNGARLTRYKGAGLLSDAEMELTFDLQGTLIESKGENDAEVSAIRERASLLRSLALTKRTTQSHGG